MNATFRAAGEKKIFHKQLFGTKGDSEPILSGKDQTLGSCSFYTQSQDQCHLLEEVKNKYKKQILINKNVIILSTEWMCVEINETNELKKKKKYQQLLGFTLKTHFISFILFHIIIIIVIFIIWWDAAYNINIVSHRSATRGPGPQGESTELLQEVLKFLVD